MAKIPLLVTSCSLEFSSSEELFPLNRGTVSCGCFILSLKWDDVGLTPLSRDQKIKRPLVCDQKWSIQPSVHTVLEQLTLTKSSGHFPASCGQHLPSPSPRGCFRPSAHQQIQQLKIILYKKKVRCGKFMGTKQDIFPLTEKCGR